MNALDNRAAFAERTQLHFLGLEAAVAFAVDNLLAFAVENRFPGDRYGPGKLVASDAQARGKAGAEARVVLVEKNGEIESVSRVVVPELMRGRAAYGFHLAAEIFAGKSVDLDVHGLAWFEVAVIRLPDLRVNLQTGNIDHFRDRTPRIHLIADVIVRKGHARKEKSARGIAVAIDDDEAINGRSDRTRSRRINPRYGALCDVSLR